MNTNYHFKLDYLLNPLEFPMLLLYQMYGLEGADWRDTP